MSCSSRALYSDSNAAFSSAIFVRTACSTASSNVFGLEFAYASSAARRFSSSASFLARSSSALAAASSSSFATRAASALSARATSFASCSS